MGKITEGIKCIVFDLGGVIINIDYHLSVKEFSKLGLVDFQNQFSQAKQSGFFDDFEIGKVSAQQFYDFMRNISGNKNISNEQIEVAWNAMLLDIPAERIKLIKLLSQQYKVLLLSNTNEVHFKSFEAQFNLVAGVGIHEIFHKAYLSHEIGRRKPNKSTFEFILNDAKADAEETLFIDDTTIHVEGAESAGIRAYLLSSGEDILNLNW